MITTNIKNNLSVNQTNGSHSITADVNQKLGGDDSGLSPHELLEASLGACTTITLMMFAKRKHWPVKDVITTVKILSEAGEVNEISRTIELKGDLTEVHRDKLLEIANKCPMHLFLEKKSKVVTSIT